MSIIAEAIYYVAKLVMDILHFRRTRPGKADSPPFYFDDPKKKEFSPLDHAPSLDEAFKGILALGDEISRQYRPELIIGISSGGAIVAGILSRKLNIPMAMIIRSSPQNEEKTPDDSKITHFSPKALDSKKILLVDDIIRTGHTFHQCYQHLASFRKQPSQVQSAVLIIETSHFDKKYPEPFAIYEAKVRGLNLPWDLDI